jgi:hypothetical protein
MAMKELELVKLVPIARRLADALDEKANSDERVELSPQDASDLAEVINSLAIDWGRAAQSYS